MNTPDEILGMIATEAAEEIAKRDPWGLSAIDQVESLAKSVQHHDHVAAAVREEATGVVRYNDPKPAWESPDGHPPMVDMPCACDPRPVGDFDARADAFRGRLAIVCEGILARKRAERGELVAYNPGLPDMLRRPAPTDWHLIPPGVWWPMNLTPPPADPRIGFTLVATPFVDGMEKAKQALGALLVAGSMARTERLAISGRLHP